MRQNVRNHCGFLLLPLSRRPHPPRLEWEVSWGTSNSISLIINQWFVTRIPFERRREVCKWMLLTLWRLVCPFPLTLWGSSPIGNAGAYGSILPTCQVGQNMEELELLLPSTLLPSPMSARNWYQQARRDILCIKEFGSWSEEQDELAISLMIHVFLEKYWRHPPPLLFPEQYEKYCETFYILFSFPSLLFNMYLLRI